MMKEVLGRRFWHSEWASPDLVLIDGGLGQVSAAQQALRGKHGVAVIGLAKRLERPAIAGYYRSLPPNDPGLNLLKRVRDEAHRFAKSYHSLLRMKRMMDN